MHTLMRGMQMRLSLMASIVLVAGCAGPNQSEGMNFSLTENRLPVQKVVSEAAVDTITLKFGPDFTVGLFEPRRPWPGMRVGAMIADGVIEEACLFEVEARVRPRVVSGQISGYATDRETRLKRTCVVMSACDTINGRPDYFALSEAVSRSPYGRKCVGVTKYGPGMVVAEPSIFLQVFAARELFRSLYEKEGQAAAKRQADISVKKPEANMDLQGRVSPFTID